jgi:Ricin-type beta-trefoil lectin domain
MTVRARARTCLWLTRTFILGFVAFGAVAQCAEANGVYPPTELVADAFAVNGVRLCLAVDANHSFKGPFSVPAVAVDGKPHEVSGAFYPVIVTPCDSVDANIPTLWTATDLRELRIQVKGAPMCLSARLLTSFLPLVDPFLEAFDATQPGSPFAYLANELKPQGKVDTKRLDASPELVASPCGLADAQDFWVYDDPSGTLSSPAGFGRRRQCVTIDTDPDEPKGEVAAGAPATAANCPDAPNIGPIAFDRSSIPGQQRWSLHTGRETLPTYPAPDKKDYFSGSRGLPITGPMGRCLTAGSSAQPIDTSDCDGQSEQDWKFVGNSLRLEAKQACLATGTDGTPGLAPCTEARNQKWIYTAKEAAANSAWKDADLFGQIRPLDDPSRCLAVVEDPFKDPVLQRNPVRVVECASVAPRQMSWFVPTQIYTIRVALVRYGHAPDHLPMAKKTDDEVKAVFADLIARMSAQYRRMGVRFVFDPDHDFRRIDDPIVNDWKDGQAAANGVAKVAAGDLYRKITFALTDRAGGGGESSATNVEYDPERIADPITGKRFDYTRWSQNPSRVLDKAGLPALSGFIEQGANGISLDPNEVIHQAHELGHYFGLGHTFSPNKFADTPDDIGSGKPWTDAGAPPCGNLRSVTVNGKIYTPDRTNNESYWGCAIGRSLNAFSPMQLAKMSWVMRAQLNRIPLVSCEPTSLYNADSVVCEDPDSLALCKETAAYLATRTGATSLSCRVGGAIRGTIAHAMKYQAVQYVFQSTPEGQALINSLAGLGKTAAPVSDKTYSDVVAGLAAGKNIPLAKALLNRVADLRELAARDHLPQWATAFTEDSKPMAPAEIEALKSYAIKIVTPEFVANAPALGQ